jgi:hypothetical protein
MYRKVTTPELKQGDIVNCHGMRCLIDRPLTPNRRSHWTQALVLNRSEVPSAVVPIGWTADWKRDARNEARPHDGEHRWTIQGNELAYWSVEEESA